MTIQSAISAAAKANINVLFNEQNWAYEFQQDGTTLFFKPNGRNEMNNQAVCFGIETQHGQVFTKANLSQAINLFKSWIA